jgi:hypothetical protein
MGAGGQFLSPAALRFVEIYCKFSVSGADVP